VKLFNGTRKEDGIPLVDIKILREKEKRLLLDSIRNNLKQPKKEERSERYMASGIIMVLNTITKGMQCDP